MLGPWFIRYVIKYLCWCFVYVLLCIVDNIRHVLIPHVLGLTIQIFIYFYGSFSEGLTPFSFWSGLASGFFSGPINTFFAL